MKQSSDVEKSADIKPTADNNGAADDKVPVDDILVEIGDFGLYQVLVAILTGIVMLLASSAQFNFVFTGDVPVHRCRIPECESADSFDFSADWLEFAIPYENGHPESCQRFQYMPSISDDDGIGACSVQNFNRSQILQCDDILIKNNEERLVTRLNMLCSGQESKMTLIATASTFGRLVGMPIAGIISDKRGRLITIIGCLLLGSIFGCLQALPVPYMSFELYLTLEFLIAFSSTGICGTCFVYNMEWVTANYRVILNCLAETADASNVYFIGLAAWYFEANFTAFRLMIALPGLLGISLYFILTESPRWLLAKQKYSQAIKSLIYAGGINGHRPSEKTIEHIQFQSALRSKVPLNNPSSEKDSDQVTMRSILRERILSIRLAVLALVWFFSIFAYYGILILSMKAHDNKYLSYVLIGAAEVPGVLLTVALMDRIGRRMTIGIPLIVYGLMLLVYTQVPATQSSIQLAILIIGRASITTAVVALYAYTIELWPTKIRNTTINFCSMVGRLGSILASLSVLLAKYYVYLPNILYGSVTIVSAILLFAFLPETVHLKKLPETLNETVAIGRHVKTERTDKPPDYL